MPTDPRQNRYPIPVERGKGPYDQYLNDNADELAVDVPAAGPLSARPAPTDAFAPRRYLATDEEIEYFNTGTSWVKITAGTAAGHYRAKAGELQAKIDEANAAGGGVVMLSPAENYTASNEGGEIHVKPSVTLHAPQVEYVIDQDVNGFFIDNYARITGNPYIHCTEAGSYTKAAVLFDQGRCMEGVYGIGFDTKNPASVHAYIENDWTGGQGLKFFAPSGGISFVRANVTIRRFGSGIQFDADPGSGYINANRIFASILGSKNLIHVKRGMARNDIWGDLQSATGGATERMFWNESSTIYGPTFWGIVFDVYGNAISPIEGPNITVITNFQHAMQFMEHQDTSLDCHDSVVFGFGENFRMGWVDTAEMWEQRVGANGWNISYYDPNQNETQIAGFTENAGFELGNNQPTQGVWGSSGEKVPLTTYSRGEDFSTTATSFSRLLGPQDSVRVDYGPMNYTNINQLYVSYTGTFDADTGNTITTQLITRGGSDGFDSGKESASQIQLTGPAFVEKASPFVAYNGSGIVNFGLEAKSGDGSQVTVRSPGLTVWGEIA